MPFPNPFHTRPQAQTEVKWSFFGSLGIRALLLTGPHGIGKSLFLAKTRAFAATGAVKLFEAKDKRQGRWSPPDPHRCDVVAFDHLGSIPQVDQQVNAALQWCERHQKFCWLAELSRADIIDLGIRLPKCYIELHLREKSLGDEISMVRGVHEVHLPMRSWMNQTFSGLQEDAGWRH